MSISEQVDLAWHFQPNQLRDTHGRWVKRPGFSATALAEQAAVIAKARRRWAAAQPPDRPIGGLAPLSPAPGTWTRGAAKAAGIVEQARQMKAEGMGPESIRSQLAKNARADRMRKMPTPNGLLNDAEIGRARALRAQGMGPESIRDQIGEDRAQHAVRRANMDTWTKADGKIIHGAHPDPGNTEANLRAAGKAAMAERQAKSALDRQLLADQVHGPAIPGRWQFIRPGSQMNVVAEPQLNDQARNSQNVWGRVIAKGGGHAAIDANDGKRHLVDWRNGGVPVHTIPLSQVGPEGPLLGRLGQSDRPVPVPEAGGLSTALRAEAAKMGLPRNDNLVGINKLLQPVGNLGDPGARPVPPPRRNPDTAALAQRAQALKAAGLNPESIRAQMSADRHLVSLQKPPRRPTGPHVTLAPGVKQQMFRFPTKAGPGNAEAQKLAKITPAELAKGTASHPSQGVQGDTAIVTLPDGTRVVHKTYTYGHADMPDADELASYTAQAIDAPTPAVARVKGGDPMEEVMGFVPGDTAYDYGKAAAEKENTGGYADYDEVNAAVGDVTDQMDETPEGQRIGLLDYLIGNPDRHTGNWMVSPDGTPVAIDNSSGFVYGPGVETNSPFWHDDAYGWDTADAKQIRASLEELKSQFKRLGHMDWYDAMMARAGELGTSDVAIGGGFSISGQLGAIELAYDPAESRDSHGRWSRSGVPDLVPAPDLLSWPASLADPGEHRAVMDYTDAQGCYLINHPLHHGSISGTPAYRTDTLNLDKLIASYTTTRDSTVYRGFAMSPETERTLKPGAVFRDDGFVSASSSVGTARQYSQMRITGTAKPALMQISVPAGSHMAPGETLLSEFVMPRGSQYRVDSIAPDGTYRMSLMP
jgi:hypothetical protein